MSLAPGARLGPYEIVNAVGAGGMGEVYRARDTRLSRDVAIKVLPAQYASDPEWRRRLEREARAASSLSHPNICTVYDVGHHDGTDFLVLEYLEGETLAARLARGPLPLAQVLSYGADIAAALAAAHRKGLVHRDLKPANVMVTRSGVRLLDFGLAKPAAPPVTATADVTITAPITAAGTIVGTFQYMSPEQVEGHEADQRSDIFALGAVLYEMATGTRAFDGKTPASVVAAILEREPPLVSQLQPLTPSAFDEIIRGCLAKDPEERWQHAHDVARQLDALRRRPEAPLVDQRGAPRWSWIAGLAALALLVAGGVYASRYLGAAREPAPFTRLALPPPEGHSFTPNDFAISPDGSRVAFVALSADGVSTLWVQSLNAALPVEIGGSEGARWPFWSPDSRSIAFFTRNNLVKVDHTGVNLQTICSTGPTANGGAWGPGGEILFSPQVFGPLSRVSAGGGTPVPVTAVSSETPGESHRFPQWLPDGKRFLYVVSWTSHQRGGLYFGRVEGGPEQRMSSTIRSGTILSAGHLLYVDGETLFAQPFDAERGVLVGNPRGVLRNEVIGEWRFGEVPMSASADGTLVFQPRNSSQLVWFDRRGLELEPVGKRGYSAPALSPDGRQIAVSYDQKGNGRPTLWVHDLERNIGLEFSTHATATAHAWSADGRWIAYSTQGEVHRIYRRATDGSQREETIVESPGHLLVNSFNRRLAFMDFLKGRTEMRLYDPESRRSEAFGIAAEAAFSPDGEWLAYLDFGTGHVVATRPGSGTRVTLAAQGSQVRWRRDMGEVFYIAPNRKMMAVPLARRGDTLVPGPAVELFQTRIVQPRLILFQYDVTPDGQKFLINSLPREDAAVPLRVILNWPRILDQ